MMNKITAVTNEALSKRWSTVAALTILLTAGKAYASRAVMQTNLQEYLAQVFVAIIIGFIVAVIIHVVLYLIFSPKKKEEAAVIATAQTPVKSKEEHEATIKAVHKELEAVKKADAAAIGETTEKKEAKPIDLQKELGISKRATKKSAGKKATKKAAPKKKAAKKKK
jgi:phosphate/sulfate permease